MEFITGFETSRFMPPHRSDILATTNHLRLFPDDLRLVRETGIKTLRYAVPWHRIEKKRGRFDWRWMDQAMESLDANDLDPIMDLVHHISIPYWVRQGFAHPDYPHWQADFASAVADRYPQATSYTPFNEPMVTTLLAGHTGTWYPFGREDAVFVPMLINVARAICLTCKLLTERDPDVNIIHVDTAERHQHLRRVPEHIRRYVEFCNDRRFICDDLIMGCVNEGHPLFHYMSSNGYTEADQAWFEENRVSISVRGLDYYPHSERDYFQGGSCAPSVRPKGFAATVEEYRAHFEEMTPGESPTFWLTETNIRGYCTDRLGWLKYMVEECEQGQVPVFCWFPFIDSTGWGETLLRVPHTQIDPVGIYLLDEEREHRHRSELSDVYRRLARGEIGSEGVPAYDFRAPVSEQLQGYMRQMRHWTFLPHGEDVESDLGQEAVAS
ncbi:MAG TPA: family 1 glycosylhydrolase [Chloroflexia bacterium]|nr:family 1 glycosylhydrolase [Chloroflexia bacterium]